MKCLIMAGGGGTRLWPLSRDQKPKQFHKIVGETSLLQITYERLCKIKGMKQEDFFVSTNNKFAEMALDQITILRDHVISEPAKRDNAAAIGLALMTILSITKNPEEIIGIFPSDHLIVNEELFASATLFASDVVKKYPKSIVTLGIRPTYPEMGFGYIQMGKEQMMHDDGHEFEAYKVVSFQEKPDMATAVKFVESFKYLWNAGMYFFRIDTMLSLFSHHLPELYKGLLEIEMHLTTANKQDVIEKIYPDLQAISIDYGVMEKTKDIIVIPVDHLGWSDVGNFKSLWEVLSKDEQENVIEGENIVLEGVTKSIIYSSKKPIICLGVNDLIVIDQGDVLFIADKKESQKIKTILAILKQKKMDELL